jgi:PAS domain S-box-containing protein
VEKLASKSSIQFKPLLLVTIAIIILLALFPLLFWNTPISSTYITILTPITSFLTLCLFIYTSWWSYKNDRDIFKAWGLLTLGMGLYFISNMLYFIFENITGTISSPSIADTFYIFAYALVIIGILFFLKKPYKIRTKVLLDVFIVMISLFFIVWFLFVWPVVKPSDPNTIAIIRSISYLFLDIILLIVYLGVLFNKNLKITPTPLVLMTLGIFSQIFGDMIYAYHAFEPNLVYKWMFTILYTSDTIFASAAAIAFLKNVEIDLKSWISYYNTSKFKSQWISYLPLILVLSTYSLLLIRTPDKALIWGVGVIIVLVVIREIVSLNEIKKAQIVLKRNKEIIASSEEQLSFITTNMLDLIMESDKNSVFRYVSPSSNEFLGIPPEKLLGKSFYEFIHPQDMEEISTNLNNAVKTGSSVRLQYRYKNAADKYIWIESIGKPIFEQGEFKGFIYSSRDISQQKKAENIVKQSLTEKETLLREIHHRVNNNLQVISSLLSLQSRKVVDERDHELFQESQNRVRSMAMIHEKLYQSDNLNSINFSDYVKTLLDSLIYDVPHKLSNINIDLDVEKIELNIETSVPCGLIINELVSNSLKHAYPEGGKGTISIKMRSLDDKYELIVADDGTGSVQQADLEEDNSNLGLYLVNTLIKQLDGTIEVLEGNGTGYRIVFQELEYQKRV